MSEPRIYNYAATIERAQEITAEIEQHIEESALRDAAYWNYLYEEDEPEQHSTKVTIER